MSKPRLSLRERKKDKTRSELLQAALMLIEVRGFDQTTIADIADAANVSPRTLLRYFPTKEDVIVSWMHDGMALLPENLAHRLPTADPVSALLASARAVMTTYGEQAEFFLTIEKVISSNSSIEARKEHVVAGVTSNVATLLTDRANSKPLSPLVADALAGTIVAITRAAIRAWLQKEGKASLSDLFDEAIEVVSLHATSDAL